MFLAEDPTVFARRVAHAHMSRAKTEALLRYHLYIDCMPTEEMAELDSDSLHRIVSTARSSPRLKQDQYVCIVSTYVCIRVYMYVYVCICVCMYVYIFCVLNSNNIIFRCVLVSLLLLKGRNRVLAY